MPTDNSTDPPPTRTHPIFEPDELDHIRDLAATEPADIAVRLAQAGLATQHDHIPTGKRKGQNPSVASIYRALAEHPKREAYPEAIEAAHADFAALKAGAVPEPRTRAGMPTVS